MPEILRSERTTQNRVIHTLHGALPPDDAL